MSFFCHPQFNIRAALSLRFILLSCFCNAQLTDSNTVLTFSFNDHTFNEANNLVKTTACGVFLVEDRFGNERSAVYLNGHWRSYLSLGTSPLLKPETITISLWVNLVNYVYAGKGYEGNPILIVKNSASDDFNMAYALFYQNDSKRFAAISTKDSLTECLAHTVNEVRFGEWYHLALVADNKHFALYLDGKLQGTCIKDYETSYLQSDSMVIGNTANKKNVRFSQGVFDDIQIYHRVLSDDEILQLYNAPNPNRRKALFLIAAKCIATILTILIVAYGLVWRRRRALLKAQEGLDLNRKLHEMEIRTLKAQMNPHFIFNALSSIQQLIMSKDNEKAEAYLAKFSKLIRKLLESNTDESLTVKDEIMILKTYLEMESLRFGSSFTYQIHVDDQIQQEQTKIPHMMVHPFVENAIWHGLLPKSGDRKLQITFQYDSDQTILCTVDDNGVGRNNGIKKKRTTFKKKSLALSFVQQRMLLLSEMMNVKGEIRFIDKKNDLGEPLGTKVLITLPTLR